MDDKNQVPQKPEAPEQPGVSPNLQPNVNNAQRFKVAQNLVMVASLAGPVSLFLGGVWLSGAGVICAIIGLRKLNAISSIQSDLSTPIKRIKKSCIIALVICSIALILNAISFYLLFPAVLEMMESGTLPGMDSGIAPGSSGGSSTWG